MINEWDENTLDWTNKPTRGEHVATFEVGPDLDVWTEIDLTDYINQHLDECGGVISFELSNITNGKDDKSRISFYSSESGENGPQLILVGEAPYQSVTETVAVETEQNQLPQLPQTVEAVAANGVKVPAPVVW